MSKHPNQTEQELESVILWIQDLNPRKIKDPVHKAILMEFKKCVDRSNNSVIRHDKLDIPINLTITDDPLTCYLQVEYIYSRSRDNTTEVKLLMANIRAGEYYLDLLHHS